MIIKRVW